MIYIICSWSSLCHVKPLFGFILFEFYANRLVSSTKLSLLTICSWSRTYILWNFCAKKTIEFCFSLNYKFRSRRKSRFEIVRTWARCVWSKSCHPFSGQSRLNCHHISCIPLRWTLFWLQSPMSWSTSFRYFGWFSIIRSFSLSEIPSRSFRSTCNWGRSICAWLTVIVSHNISFHGSMIKSIILRRSWSLPKSSSIIHLFYIVCI